MADTIVKGLKGRLAYVIVGELWLLYAFLLIFAPPAQNSYSLSQLQIWALQATILLPVLGIWLVAAYGAVRFKQYTFLIAQSRDGAALSRVTDGVFVLILSFIIQSLLGVLRRYAIDTPLLEPLVFLHNHLPLLLALTGVAFIFHGSAHLAKLVTAPLSSSHLLAVFIPFTLASALFAVYFYLNISHEATNGIPSFALSGKLPFFTLALPYLIVWLLGLLSLVNIANYIRHVKGAIYKAALRYLAYGLMTVVSFAIAVQALSVASTFLSRVNLGPLLLLIYALLIMYALGFVLIAVGARRLAKIEAAQ